MKLTTFVASDPGRVRELNEDSARTVHAEQSVLVEERGDLLVVADGMGGHDAGEIASAEAVEAISTAYYQEAEGTPAVALTRAIEIANARIFERAQREERYGMGTTVVAAAHVQGLLHIAHVGDSRLYLIRDGAIRSLTDDHSLVAEQVAAGILTPEEAARHPHRNVISRAVGTAPTVEVELSSASPLRLLDGDVILLCSDGLTEHLTSEQIHAILSTVEPERAATQLVNAANAAGGTDNITVLLAFVGAPRRARRKGPDTAPMPTLGAQTAPHTAIGDRTAPHPSAESPTRPLPAVGAEAEVDEGIGGVLVVGLLVLGFVLAIGLFAIREMTGSSDGPVVEPSVTIAPTVAASPEGERLGPLVAPGASEGQPEIVLLSPSDARRAEAEAVTFRARLTNLEPEDTVELWMGRTPNFPDLERVSTLAEADDAFEVAKTTPPDEVYGLWYWTIVVRRGEALFAAPELRALFWSEP